MSYAEDQYVAGDQFAIDAVRDERAAFIRNTYAHLAIAIAVFAGLIYLFLNNQAIRDPLVTMFANNYWIMLLGFMGVSWLADYWARSGASPSTQYMGLILYTVAQAVIFTPLVFFAAMFGGPETIVQAGMLTLITFGGLTAFVLMTGADFSFLRTFLFVAGLLALGAVLIGTFTGFNLGIWFVVGMLGLSAGYILYDTSNVMHHYRTDQHVAAALALFASVALMFWYMIQLVMSLQGDD